MNKYLADQNCPYSSNLLEDSVVNSFEVFKFLHQHTKLSLTENVFNAAASQSEIEFFEYLYDNKCPWGPKTSACAAEREKVMYIKWLHERGCTWDASTTKNAAEYDNLEVLKYVMENGCPRHTKLIKMAASNNNLKMVKYLHRSGCNWNPEAYREACENGNIKLIMWASNLDLEVPQNFENFNPTTKIQRDCKEMALEKYNKQQHEKILNDYRLLELMENLKDFY
eukprot:TRINITY_DN127_c0_g1_i1.p2 TRINITY_DN127_c0_g1~~TRINITY_DN127_c0_g1_i1.p2  ORF type:complete len:225 (+),score=28.65 TRINITY_DN127_c0_g1_i1:1206-1880(+)